jgi:hypothetical protein
VLRRPLQVGATIHRGERQQQVLQRFLRIGAEIGVTHSHNTSESTKNRSSVADLETEHRALASTDPLKRPGCWLEGRLRIQCDLPVRRHVPRLESAM